MSESRYGGKTDGGERDDEENGDGYEPTGSQTVGSVRWIEQSKIRRYCEPMHPIDRRLNGVHDLVMVEDEECADDDDDKTNGVIDCRRSMGAIRGEIDTDQGIS